MQLDYTINQAVAREGMIADATYYKDVASLKAAAGPVFIGRVVTRGTDSEDIVHPDAIAEVTNELAVRGVVLHAHNNESKRDELDASWPEGSVVPVMRKGRVWVKALTNATEQSGSVHVVVDGSEPLGALRGTADSTNTAVLPKARWITSTSGADQLAVLELGL